MKVINVDMYWICYSGKCSNRIRPTYIIIADRHFYRRVSNRRFYFSKISVFFFNNYCKNNFLFTFSQKLQPACGWICLIHILLYDDSNSIMETPETIFLGWEQKLNMRVCQTWRTRMKLSDIMKISFITFHFPSDFDSQSVS